MKSLTDLVKENQRERLREQMHEESSAAASCVAVVAVEPLAFVHVAGAFNEAVLANVAVLFPKPINSVRDSSSFAPGAAFWLFTYSARSRRPLGL